MSNIAPNHNKFHSQYIKIFVPRSKTDVYRECNYVYISTSGTRYRPVGVLRKYMDLAGIHVRSNLPLFRPLVFHRCNSSYSLRDAIISYTSCREILMNSLKQLGFNADDYGLHSLRSVE